MKRHINDRGRGDLNFDEPDSPEIRPQTFIKSQIQSLKTSHACDASSKMVSLQSNQVITL